MVKFNIGDTAFHRGSWTPVTILEHVQVWDGVDTRPGYRVMMEGWSGPQDQIVSLFLTYEENREYMETQLMKSIDTLHRAAGEVTGWKNDLDRLLAWGEAKRKDKSSGQ